MNYRIEQNLDSKMEPNMYLKKNIMINYVGNLLLFALDLAICITSIMIAFSLMSTEPSVVAFFFALVIPFALLSYLRIKKFTYVIYAIYYSKFFSQTTRPFIETKILTNNSPAFIINTSISNILRKLKGAIKKGYLINCTVEIHGGMTVIALSKKVVKDICPYCGAPLVDAFNDNYVCEYCRKKIPNVIIKK